MFAFHRAIEGQHRSERCRVFQRWPAVVHWRKVEHDEIRSIGSGVEMFVETRQSRGVSAVALEYGPRMIIQVVEKGIRLELAKNIDCVCADPFANPGELIAFSLLVQGLGHAMPILSCANKNPQVCGESLKKPAGALMHKTRAPPFEPRAGEQANHQGTDSSERATTVRAGRKTFQGRA